MPKMKTRNRSQEALARGNVLRAFEISKEANTLIDRTAETLAVDLGNCTRTQALERLIREGSRRLLKR